MKLIGAILNILIKEPTVMNKHIEKANLSIDGVGSRRMYGYFEIKETKYKKSHYYIK